MLIFGDLVVAGLEELASDPTDPLVLFSGRIYRRTTDGVIRIYTGTSWKTLADTDTAQAMSAKVINTSTVNDTHVIYTTSGASSSEFQIPRMTTTERLAIQSPSISRVVYDTTLKSLFVYNGSTWTPAGGGAALKSTIEQTAHGFNTADIGCALYLNGGVYAKAKADAANTAEVVGFLDSLVDLNTFTVTMAGEVRIIRTMGEGDLVPGSVYFLSTTDAGRVTATEPTVVGQISQPVGVAKANNILVVNIMRGTVVGGANLRTTINLANNATTTIQNVSAYEAGELAGYISIGATTPLKFYVQAQFSRNGANTDFNISHQVSGDTPPVGFSIQITSAGLIQVVLPNITGFGSASISFSLNAPAVGVTLPLSIDSSLIVGDTNPVGTLLDYAGTTAPSGYLMCDGRSLATDAYSKLFAVIGYSYGGSGTSFKIPDFRGRFARYSDNMGTALGAAGRDTATRATDKSQGQATAKNGLSASTGGMSANATHSHTLANASVSGNTYLSRGGANIGTYLNYGEVGDANTDHTHAVTITGDTETRPINVSCNKIIKY